MIVECDRCSAKYSYDESRFGGKASKKVRCARCGAIFEIFNTRAFESQGPMLTGEETTVSRHSSAGGSPAAAATKKNRAAPSPGRQPAPDLKLPADRKLSLAVIAGAESGRIYPIERPRLVLGRQGSDVPIEDPEVSRQHAAIEVSGDRVTLVDLGSTNGTFVGEQPIQGEAPLENQDEFTIGATTLMLIVTEGD